MTERERERERGSALGERSPPGHPRQTRAASRSARGKVGRIRGLPANSLGGWNGGGRRRPLVGFGVDLKGGWRPALGWMFGSPVEDGRCRWVRVARAERAGESIGKSGLCLPLSPLSSDGRYIDAWRAAAEDARHGHISRDANGRRGEGGREGGRNHTDSI